MAYFGSRYFSASYFGRTYWATGAEAVPQYYGSRYFAPSYFGQHYWGTIPLAEVIVIPPVEEIPAGGGVFRPLRPRPALVEGEGFGILPELEGEGHGVVIRVAAAVGILSSLVGETQGAIGATGHSAGRLIAITRAMSVGVRGEVGTGTIVIRLSGSSAGVAGLHGSGLGKLMKLEGAARARHDDDETAIMALLAA